MATKQSILKHIEQHLLSEFEDHVEVAHQITHDEYRFDNEDGRGLSRMTQALEEVAIEIRRWFDADTTLKVTMFFDPDGDDFLAVGEDF